MSSTMTLHHHHRRSLPTSASSSYNKHAIFFVKLLLVITILLLLPQLVESKNKRRKRQRKLNRKYTELRINCTIKDTCKPFNAAENEMCITKCMDAGCHEDVYGSDRGGELEPGEVDEVREIEFEKCVKASLKKKL